MSTTPLFLKPKQAQAAMRALWTRDLFASRAGLAEHELVTSINDTSTFFYLKSCLSIDQKACWVFYAGSAAQASKAEWQLGSMARKFQTGLAAGLHYGKKVVLIVPPLLRKEAAAWVTQTPAVTCVVVDGTQYEPQFEIDYLFKDVKCARRLLYNPAPDFSRTISLHHCHDCWDCGKARYGTTIDVDHKHCVASVRQTTDGVLDTRYYLQFVQCLYLQKQKKTYAELEACWEDQAEPSYSAWRNAMLSDDDEDDCSHPKIPTFKAWENKKRKREEAEEAEDVESAGTEDSLECPQPKRVKRLLNDLQVLDAFLEQQGRNGVVLSKMCEPHHGDFIPMAVLVKQVYRDAREAAGISVSESEDSDN